MAALLGCGPALPSTAAPAPAVHVDTAPPAVAARQPASVLTRPGGELILDGDARRWVDATLEGMSLERKIAQLVVAWSPGGLLVEGSDDHARLAHWVRDVGIGGVIVTIGPAGDMALRLDALQALARVPLIIGTDMEHGPGQRLDAGTPAGILLPGGTEFPVAMAYGAAGDPALVEAMARATAAEARAVGLHWNFAPVVDVNNNPANPIINVRSYGEDPAAVSELAVAMVQGLQAGGVLATAKHFPGHGDVELDSHIRMPVLDVSFARLDSIELPPFRAAIDAGVASVMTAHIAFPRLTGDSLPATLSRELLTDLLRRRLGFDGLIVTDAMNMGGLLERHGADRVAIEALQAGADVLLQPLDPAATVDHVAAAVRAGELDEARIDRSVRRVLSAKAALALHEGARVPLSGVNAAVGAPQHARLAEEAARRSIVVARDQQQLLPIDETEPLVLVTYSASGDPSTGSALRRALGAHPGGLLVHHLDAAADSLDIDRVEADALANRTAVFALFVRPVAGLGSISLPPDVAALIQRVAQTAPAVVVSFGNPYLLREFDAVETYMLAWGAQNVAQRAAADALLGKAPVTGRLPISLPPYHPIGAGVTIGAAAGSAASAAADSAARPTAPPPQRTLDRDLRAALEEVDTAITRAVADSVTPGAALAIGLDFRPVRLRGYGHLDWDSASPPVDEHTLYDLASLTKVVATTTAAMLLVDDGLLDLDTPIGEYLPALADAPVGAVSSRQLLTHRAGLPPFLPFWRSLTGQQAILTAIADVPLQATPGARRDYSDIGLIVMGAVIETLAQEPLPSLLRQRVFAPLGMDDTGFNPLGDAPSGARAGCCRRLAGLERIAPTEVDTIYRHRHVHGHVHDENAYAMGGVAGHAGLFSTADDLAVFARMLLRGGELHGQRIISNAVVRRFTEGVGAADDIASERLGWHGADVASWPGDSFSDRAFGHTGFTGTSMWLDPEHDVFVVLLTNRVNPSREHSSATPLRRDVHAAVGAAIGDDAVGATMADEAEKQP